MWAREAVLRGIDASRPRQAIVRHATALCGELGIRVVAKGVETAAERATRTFCEAPHAANRHVRDRCAVA